MKQFKIGIMAESFRKPIAEGIKTAASLGADGLQIYGVRGEITADITKQQRHDLLAYINENGLEVSAVCGDFGGHGFGIRKDNPKKIEDSKRVIELAKDLGTNIITTHIGMVPTEKNEAYETLFDACTKLAEAAKAQDAVFAIETGPELAATLKGFLDDIGSSGIGVNYDPANLVMVAGEDIVQGVYTLRDYIVHTHAKDGKRLQPIDPARVYANFTEEFVNYKDYFIEVPLGEGGVDFDKYLAALSDIGYNGYLTIEREVGDQPETDIRMAVNFLKERIG